MRADLKKSFAPYRPLLIVTLIYTLITLVLFLPVTLNPTQTVANYQGNYDLFQNLWNLWWIRYSITVLHTPPYFTNMLFYPTGADLATQTMQPIAGLLSIPLQYLSLVLAYNFVFMLGFILSGLSMYLLANHIVKNRYAAFVAGLIFAFGPIHIAQSFTHLQWTSIEWMPLFILFFLKGIESKGNRHEYALGAAAFFILTTFMGDIEQGIMVALFAVMFLFFYIQLTARREDYKRILLFLAETAGIVLVLGLPFLIPIARGVLYFNALGISLSNLSSSLLWSNSLLSFFVPSYFNGLLGGVARANQGLIYGNNSVWEGTSYIGYSVLFLAVAGVYYSNKNKQLLKASPWLYLFIGFAALSLGPLVLVGMNYVLPGIYLIYHFIPVLNIIREPGRFDVIAQLCLAVLAAYGLKYLLSPKKHKHDEKIRNTICTMVLSLVILIEYLGVPYLGPSANATFYNATFTSIPQGYSYIASSGQEGAVIILPQSESALAMYYQTEFEKPIFNAYVTREGIAEYADAQSLPLLRSCTDYAGGGESPKCDYPILENYTLANRLLMPMYSVSFIALDKADYGNRDLELMAGSLNAIASPVFSDNTTMIFKTTKYTGKPDMMVSYIAGLWNPSQGADKNDTKNFWFAGNDGIIKVYSPQGGDVKVAGTMTALANLTVAFYLNGNKTYGASLKKGVNYKYSFHSLMGAGYSQIGFSTNSTSDFVFGIRNTTIENLSDGG